MANTHNQKSGKRFLSVWRYLCHVHTNAFSKVDVVVIKKASIASRQYYRFNAFSTFHTKTPENDRISRRDVSWTLCACYKHTLPRYFTTHVVHVKSSFSFRCVFDRFRPSTLIHYVCVSVLMHFLEHFQTDAFFMKTLGALVWTEGLNASKCMRFKTKTLWCGRGLSYHQ